MPKQDIDYSNTIFYKISCKDVNIKELYIGHTTNFVQRKHCHKQICNNEKNANHNLKVYKCIRDNGGWNNWKMEIIGFRECYDHYEARKIEQKYFESLNATLNSIEPFPKPKPRPETIAKEKTETNNWNCDTCGTICQTEKQFLIHQESNKHKRNLNHEKKMPKNALKFLCEVCDFKCSKQSNYERHLLTAKHQNRTLLNKKTPKNAETYYCECGKSYKARNSLWYHKKKCNIDFSVSTENREMEGSTMEYLLKENMEMKKDNMEMKQMMIEMMGKMGNTTNNTMNNQFNINMFLNETCKNAMNLSDFIERIEISHDDLENNAQLGFVNGITKILMDNLKLLAVQERPIHCTDVKRETLYVKDADVWDKAHSNEKLENAIQEVSRKSLQSLINWKKTNPDYNDLDSDFSKKTVYMQQNSTALCKKESFYPKIIHNLAKENSISQLKV
jgi:hypothetical protein